MRVKMLLIFDGLTLSIILNKKMYFSKKHFVFHSVEIDYENHNFVCVIDPIILLEVLQAW